MLADIQHSIRMKSISTYEERVDIARHAYGYLDDMKTNPNFENFLNVVDTLNVLNTLITVTDTEAKCKKAYNCESAHEWLWEVGHQNIIKTINDCQEGLFKTSERAEKTGSWALDGNTFALCEECFQMYQELYSMLPRAVILWAIKKCAMAHKKIDENFKIQHMFFHQEYVDKENLFRSIKQ